MDNKSEASKLLVNTINNGNAKLEQKSVEGLPEIKNDVEFIKKNLHKVGNGASVTRYTSSGLEAIDPSLVEKFENKGVANGYTPLDTNAKIPSAYIPDIAIKEIFVVDSEIAMLSLNAQQGDTCKCTDIAEVFQLRVNDPTVLANWESITMTSNASVSSVNGETGDVLLTTGDLSEDIDKRYVTDAEKTSIGTIGNKLDKATNVTSIRDTGILDGHIAVFNLTNKDIRTSSQTVTTSLGSNDSTIPTSKAVKDYADGLVAGLLDYRGGYNASVNTFPASDGSGTAGAVLKGDMWIVSVAGTLGGSAVQIGDSVIAGVDTPGQTASNWNILNSNISYVPEDVTNKVTSLSGASTDTQYPSAKLAYDQLALKAPKGLATASGLTMNTAKVLARSTASVGAIEEIDFSASSTANSIVRRDANKNILGNNIIGDYTTTATAGASTTLTVGSTYQQRFTGTLNQTVVLPVATTLSNGMEWQISNDSTGLVTVNTSGGNTLIVIPSGGTAFPLCKNTAGGTGLASWAISYEIGLNTKDTLTNKRIDPRKFTTTTTATLTPDLSLYNTYRITAQSGALTIAAPTGTPTIDETIVVTVYGASAIAVTLNGTYKTFGSAFSGTTVAGKRTKFTMTYSGSDWELLWANEV